MKKTVILTLSMIMAIGGIAVAGTYLMKSGQSGPYYHQHMKDCWYDEDGEIGGAGCRRSKYYTQNCAETSVPNSCTPGQWIDAGFEYGECFPVGETQFICLYE